MRRLFFLSVAAPLVLRYQFLASTRSCRGAFRSSLAFKHLRSHHEYPFQSHEDFTWRLVSIRVVFAACVQHLLVSTFGRHGLGSIVVTEYHRSLYPLIFRPSLAVTGLEHNHDGLHDVCTVADLFADSRIASPGQNRTRVGLTGRRIRVPW